MEETTAYDYCGVNDKVLYAAALLMLAFGVAAAYLVRVLWQKSQSH